MPDDAVPNIIVYRIMMEANDQLDDLRGAQRGKRRNVGIRTGCLLFVRYL
jgi:hypothetical protein